MRRCYTPKKFGPAALRTIAQAEQICSQYAADGYDLTLRQLYYQFVARGLIANKQTEYKRLGSIVNDARLAGLLDWNYIVDRTRNLSDLAHWDNPAEIVAAIASQFRLARWDRQPVRVEVWVEKEALAGVVQRVCQRLDVPFFACRGYVSQSESWAAGQRVGRYVRSGQRVVILHLGDHDPSGIDMTRDNSERLLDFVLKDHVRGAGRSMIASEVGRDMAKVFYLQLDYEGQMPVEVKRIALNMDQVEEYEPPPNPAKLTDSRVAGYLDRFGDQSWELDALPPDVLARLIEDEVEVLRDENLWSEAAAEEEEHRELLGLASTHWPEVVSFLQDLS